MNKHLIFKILTVWFLLTQCFPPYFYFVPMGGALCLSVFIGAGFLMFPDLLAKKSIIAMIIYGMITLMYFFSGNDFFRTSNDVIVPFLNMMSALLLLEYVLKYDHDYKFTKLVVLEVFSLNVLMAFISIPQLMVNRNIIRGASASGIEDAESQVYYWVMSYGTVHGLPILMAALVFLCRKARGISALFFWFWMFITATIYIIVFQSNATTSFIMATLLVVAALLFRFEIFNYQNIARLIIVGLFSLFLTAPPILVPIIDLAQSTMSTNSDNYYKMNELRDNAVYGEADGDFGGRQALYESSSKLFFESPLLGTPHPELIGHHSFIVDRFALFGIFMIIPLVVLFVVVIRTNYHNLIHSRVPYAFGIAGLILMLYYKNEFGSGTWLYGFAVLPILCRYIDYLIEFKQRKSIKLDKI